MIIKKMNVVLLGILLIFVLIYVTGCDSLIQPIIQKYLLTLATNIDVAGTVAGGGLYSIGQKIQVRDDRCIKRNYNS